MPDILYIKTSDGVILRFAERTAFRTWVMSGRIPLADEVFWLDAAENWRPLQELLDILGIVLPAPSADAQDSKAFPGIQDDFFKKSFGPLATAGGEPREGEWGTVRRPVITGRYGAVQDVVDVGQPKRRTTAPMAAFDVASDHAGGAAPAGPDGFTPASGGAQIPCGGTVSTPGAEVCARETVADSFWSTAFPGDAQ